MPKDGLMIALGIGKPKSGLPPSLRSNRTGAAPSSPAPNASPQMDAMEPDGDEGGKADPDEAGVVLANEKCGDCSNWHYDTGDCDAVQGNFKACDGCRKYFEAKDGGMDMNEPDADDMGAEPAKTPSMMGAQG